MTDPAKSYLPPEIALARRERFCQILREGKRMCKLESEERAAVVELAIRLEKRNKELRAALTPETMGILPRRGGKENDRQN